MCVPTESEIAKAVFQATAETFEVMGFIELNSADPEASDMCDSDVIWSRIEVTGPFAGSVCVFCPTSLAREITGSLYNEDEVTAQRILDTIGEIGNTVAGKCLSLLVPAHQTFAVGLPQTGEGRPPPAKGHLYKFVTDDLRSLWVFFGISSASPNHNVVNPCFRA